MCHTSGKVVDYSGFTNIKLDYKLKLNNNIYGLEDAMTMNGYLQLGWNKSCVDLGGGGIIKNPTPKWCVC
jgi:hypothetical protein